MYQDPRAVLATTFIEVQSQCTPVFFYSSVNVMKTAEEGTPSPFHASCHTCV